MQLGSASERKQDSHGFRHSVLVSGESSLASCLRGLLRQHSSNATQAHQNHKHSAVLVRGKPTVFLQLQVACMSMRHLSSRTLDCSIGLGKESIILGACACVGRPHSAPSLPTTIISSQNSDLNLLQYAAHGTLDPKLLPAPLRDKSLISFDSRWRSMPRVNTDATSCRGIPFRKKDVPPPPTRYVSMQ